MPIEFIANSYNDYDIKSIKEAAKTKGRQVANAIRPYTKPEYYKQKKQSYFEKLAILKSYNIDIISCYKMATMNDEDFYKLIDIIKNNPQEEKRLLNGKTDFTMHVSKSEMIDNVLEKTYYVNFNNSARYYQEKDVSTKEGDNNLSFKRTQTSKGGIITSKYIDTSSFNPEYKINNQYSEKITRSDSNLKSVTNKRSIRIADKNDRPIFNYDYSKRYNRVNKTTEYIVDGITYTVTQTSDDKIAISYNGNKIVLDILSKYEPEEALLNDIDTSKKEGLSEEKQKLLDEKAILAETKIDSQKRAILIAAKKLPPEILISFYKNFDKITNNPDDFGDRTFVGNFMSPDILAKSIIDACILKSAKQKGLFEDEILIKTFERERQNFINWLNEPKLNCLAKGEKFYLDKLNINNDDMQKSLSELLINISELLWVEDYDEGRLNDEEKRLLLNFFPETIAYLG